MGERDSRDADGSPLDGSRVTALFRRTVARIGAALGGAPTWSAEDYVAALVRTPDPDDHWAPPAGARAEPPVVDPQADPAAEPDPPAFDWFADEPAASPIASEPDDPFEAVLPTYDPDATTALPSDVVFDRPHAFRIDTKAGLLARETGIPDRAGRERAARLFEEALDEERWPGLFSSWKQLAPAIDCPRLLRLVFELRGLWEDSPHLWRYRTAPGRPSSWHESARGQFSWRRAIAIARADPGATAWAALDDDLLSEWEDLVDPCPGFWSVADYAELRATGDEAEAEVFAILARDGRERRALHLQEGCGHLDWRRGGPTARVSSAFETGVSIRARTIEADGDADDDLDGDADGGDPSDDGGAQSYMPGVRYE